MSIYAENVIFFTLKRHKGMTKELHVPLKPRLQIKNHKIER